MNRTKDKNVLLAAFKITISIKHDDVTDINNPVLFHLKDLKYKLFRMQLEIRYTILWF